MKYRCNFPHIVDTMDVMPDTKPRCEWQKCESPGTVSVGKGVEPRGHLRYPTPCYIARRLANGVRRALSLAFEVSGLPEKPLVILWKGDGAMILPYKRRNPVRRHDGLIVLY